MHRANHQGAEFVPQRPNFSAQLIKKVSQDRTGQDDTDTGIRPFLFWSLLVSVEGRYLSWIF
jgi:hypothetical protein